MSTIKSNLILKVVDPTLSIWNSFSASWHRIKDSRTMRTKKGFTLGGDSTPNFPVAVYVKALVYDLQ